MIIKNGKLYRDGSFKNEDLYIKNGVISSEFLQEDEEVLVDAEGCYVVPGLIDIHTHGCMGQDFCNGTYEALSTMARYELSQGVTGFCPTSMTLDEEKLAKVFQIAAIHKNIEAEAEIFGINMEGPFISREKIGAQNPKHLHELDLAMFKRLQEQAKGLIKLVDIAPELAGAKEFIEAVKDEVKVSLAHSNAPYEVAKVAFEAGANHVTHLFNGMIGFGHREPGIIGAAAERDDVYLEIICDGIHVHPAAVRATFKLFGAEKMVLISDSMEATGLPDGQYQLGGLPVTKEGRRAYNTGTSTIAGSVTSLLDCLRWTVKEAGIPLEKALDCATINPARSIGVDSFVGSLEAGKQADIILLDKNLNLIAVVKKGRVYYA